MPPNEGTEQPAGAQAGGSAGAGAGAHEEEKQSRSKAWEAVEQYKKEATETKAKLADYERKEKEAEERAAKARGEHEKVAEQAKKEAVEIKARYEAERRRNALLEASQRAGLRSTRYLSLIDPSKLELIGDEVRGADDALAALKKEDPTLFGAVDVKRNNSDTGTAPGTRGAPLIDPQKAYSVQEVEAFDSKQRAEYLRIHGVVRPRIDPMTGRGVS